MRGEKSGVDFSGIRSPLGSGPTHVPAPVLAHASPDSASVGCCFVALSLLSLVKFADVPAPAGLEQYQHQTVHPPVGNVS